MEDKVLVLEVLKGDQWAFRQLIDKYQRLVVHMVARLVDDDRDREELCQDVFVKVYESLDTFKFDAKLSTWIATIAYRMAVNHLRKRNRKIEEQDLEAVHFSIGQEDHSVERTDYATFIHSLIAQMPVNYRTVLTLYYLEGFSYPEIVKVTEMPEGTVKNYLFRAKQKLRALSEPYVGKEIHDL
ncbi:RNA polymerase sigma factor [Marinoscillum sp.]|uniref:RNA polymerase sigma factor n=1 Tax=Marinoscillum sp. TaxID=2024838 RepID=UPI003BAA500F